VDNAGRLFRLTPPADQRGHKADRDH